MLPFRTTTWLLVFHITFLPVFLTTYSANGKSQSKALLNSNVIKPDFQKVIDYFKRKGALQELKAAQFLIANISAHESATYFWMTSTKKRIPFRELGFRDYGKAQAALSELKKTYPDIHPQKVTIPDAKSLNPEFLIKNIEKAFYYWRKSSYEKIPFEVFCEYVLPYRTSIEPVQEWRDVYAARNKWFLDSLKKNGLEKALIQLSYIQKSWFKNTWRSGPRSEPLPRLGALQILFRKEGMCEDEAALTEFSLRSVGVPVAQNLVPYWATATGGHFFNTVFKANGEKVHYDESNSAVINFKLQREPGKVLRLTFSKQSNVLASQIPSQDIPMGILQTHNYIDVTQEFWPTCNVTTVLYPRVANGQIIYSCIFNGLIWKPIWWSRANNQKAEFKNMSKGVVYLPAAYNGQKMIPIGYPTVQGYNHVQVLKPITNERSSISISNQSKFLKIKPYTKYKLYYWDQKWKLISYQNSSGNSTSLNFQNIPKNCLYLLIPGKPRGTERPFIFESNKVIWF